MHSCCSDTLFLLMLVFFLSPCRLLYSNSPSPHSFSLPLSSLSSVSLWLDFPHCLPSLCPLTLNFLTASFTLSTNTEFPHCLPSLCPLTLDFPRYSSPSLQTILQSLQWIWETLVPSLWSSPTSSSSSHVWATSPQGWLQAQEPVRW